MQKGRRRKPYPLRSCAAMNVSIAWIAVSMPQRAACRASPGSRNSHRNNRYTEQELDCLSEASEQGSGAPVPGATSLVAVLTLLSLSAPNPPPPVGYPVRAEEPDCAHYLKKGWCAFGPTCKYNHPEIVGGLSSYGLGQPPTAYVSLPTTTFPSAAVYSVPSAVPTLYYLPPGMGPNQLAGSTVSLLPSAVGAMAAAQPNQLAFTQQGALGGGTQATMYRQPAAASPRCSLDLSTAVQESNGRSLGHAVFVCGNACAAIPQIDEYFYAPCLRP
eukprot:XP_001697030.1 predicted protein [Chlamydomonas reinhardtii]